MIIRRKVLISEPKDSRQQDEASGQDRDGCPADPGLSFFTRHRFRPSHKLSRVTAGASTSRGSRGRYDFEFLASIRRRGAKESAVIGVSRAKPG